VCLPYQLRRVLLALACWLASGPALALEPAGGPPVPPGMDPQDFVSASDLPDASVEDRGWLAESSAEEPARVTPSASSHNPLLSLLALLLVASLGGGALWLQRRKAKAVTPAGVESRLSLLSSTRIGPKAFAVSAEVNGRVILLGVTDQQVTNLGWLDPPELEQELPAEQAEEAAAEEDDLPEDYPGSALREAARQASSLVPGSLQPPPPQASPLTSTQNLKRFQEVLRGAIPDQPQSMRAPRMTAPMTSAEMFGRSMPPAADAATTLAAMTSDVVGSEPAPGAGRSVAPASLRRKRQRRSELTTKPAKQSAKAPVSDSAAPPSIEGQVAGLRAMKNG
jgi:flagellar biogenesis protein FliO